MAEFQVGDRVVCVGGPSKDILGGVRTVESSRGGLDLKDDKGFRWSVSGGRHTFEHAPAEPVKFKAGDRVVCVEGPFKSRLGGVRTVESCPGGLAVKDYDGVSRAANGGRHTFEHAPAEPVRPAEPDYMERAKKFLERTYNGSLPHSTDYYAGVRDAIQAILGVTYDVTRSVEFRPV